MIHLKPYLIPIIIFTTGISVMAFGAIVMHFRGKADRKQREDFKLKMEKIEIERYAESVFQKCLNQIESE